MPALPPKADFGHRGQHDREVQAERADHPDQEDRPRDVRAAGAGSARLAAVLGVRARPGRAEVGGPEQQQADRRADVAGRVDREHPAGARRRDEHARDGGADQPGRLEHRRVQRDRGAQPARGTTSVTNACRVGASNAKTTPLRQRERVHVGRAHRAQERDHRERRGGNAVERLGDRAGCAASTAGRRSPRVQAEQQDRQELQGHRHADGGRAVRQAEDQPVLGDALHPGAGVGQALAGEVDPVAARREGGEGASRLPIVLGGSH